MKPDYKSKMERLLIAIPMSLHSDAEMRKFAIKPDLERGFQKSKRQSYKYGS